MITRAHCLLFVGHRVVVQTRDGVTHDGILHSVTNEGIYMRPFGAGRSGMVSDAGDDRVFDVLQNMPQSADDLQEVFFPFFFFPFFALAAVRPRFRRRYLY